MVVGGEVAAEEDQAAAAAVAVTAAMGTVEGLCLSSYLVSKEDFAAL